MQVDAEPAERRKAERGIGNAGLAKLLDGVRRQQRNDRRGNVVAVEHQVGDRRQQAVDANHGRPSGHQQQVAALTANDFGQPLFHPARAFEEWGVRGRGRVQFADQGIEIVHADGEYRKTA